MMPSASQRTNKQKIIIAYVPVLHEGYRRFFDKHESARKLFILGSDFTRSFVPLTKDLRALHPELIRDSILAWKRFDVVDILSADEAARFPFNKHEIVMPDEDVMHEIHSAHFPNAKVEFDSIFLRWDKHKSSEGKSISKDQTISASNKDNKIMSLLMKEAKKSSDWWRHVAAAIVKGGKIVSMTHNQHLPNQQMPYINGDPRSDFHKGENIELSTAMHAEAALIAEAARKGISLKGSSMYVTTFPCPPCAKLIAYSGITKLYYSGGYGVLDGESILKNKGVEIIFVDTTSSVS